MSHDPKDEAVEAEAEHPDTVPPPSGEKANWDEQPTVNLTGDDLPLPADTGEIPAVPEGDGGPEPGAEEAEGDEQVEQARALSTAHLKGLVEALVFASDKPMKDREIARMASAPVKQVRALLAEMKPEYVNRGIVLDEVAGGWLFRTNVQYAPFVREMSADKPVRLTRAQVETLAIVAYRQPVTRPEIDDIRGVDSGATLKLLLERDLVRILGKKDEPGRPLLYGTTQQFLEFFGLRSLKDLPTLKEFTELSEESRQVAEAELGEVLPDMPRTTAPGPAPVPSEEPPPALAEEEGASVAEPLAEEAPHEDTIAPPPGPDTVAPPSDVQEAIDDSEG